MFHSAYVAVQKHFRLGPWYHEADMRTGRAINLIMSSSSSFYVWKKFGVLPERYLLDHQMLHPTEKYYPLCPEFAESTFYLYQATKGPEFENNEFRRWFRSMLIENGGHFSDVFRAKHPDE
ncbi:hypothetical protein P8452_50024 [Trifolium repens]|nr:hypothetical protein P8452_50024 [Trifolium repens]